MEDLKAESLIELHDRLNDFAKYHYNRGGQAAHSLIKKRLIDDVKGAPRDGSNEGRLIDSGYDAALKAVLNLLHKEFVP